MKRFLRYLLKNIGNIFQIALFISVLAIIFWGTPLLAKFIKMLDVEVITKFLEIVFVSTLALTVAFMKNK